MGSSVQTLVFVLIAMLISFLGKNKSFKSWASSLLETSLSDYFLPSKHAIVTTPGLKINQTSKRIKGATDCTLYELVQTLTQLQEYLPRAQRQNGVVFNRAKGLDEESLEQLREISYFTKIQKVNESVQETAKVLEAVIKNALEKVVKNNITESDDETIPDQLRTICADLGYDISSKNELRYGGSPVVLTNSTSNQGRVNEAISHLCRDWSDGFQMEREPINKFIVERIKKIKTSGKNNTLVVVPGAGAGQLPFSIAKNFPNCQVESVEWSSLMYIVNEFALDHKNAIKIRPFSQHYSGSTDTRSQIRAYDVPLNKIKRPSNLATFWGDFRRYTIDGDHYDEIIVCTAFFIDTAENVFEYFKAIEKLSAHCNTLHWINVGPLKYGTRPVVQFTADELKKLRMVRGWNDLVEVRLTEYEAGLNGYLTNTESLYQGYYGLLKFHSVFNNRKSE